MSTLYRRYRPARFSQVAGQEHVTSTLQQAVVSGRIAHAYLFHGPRGTGKTTTARILARRLNCRQPKAGEPCGKCDTCTAAQENRLLDVIEIDAASNRGIDDIRALQEGAGLRASLGNYKVYIIDEVHMLTKEAFTALLKTLEEPAPKVVFILASTEFHKIPETIISRCQVFHFRRASEANMRERLQFLLQQEKREVSNEALEFIMQRSDGCYRDAESLLGQVLTRHEGVVTYDNVSSFLGLPPQELLKQFLSALERGESAPALAAVDEALRLGSDVEQFIKESIRLARDRALAAIKENRPTAEDMPRIIRALVQAMQDLAYVPEPQIALHLVIVSVCKTQGSVASLPATRLSSPLDRELGVERSKSEAPPAGGAKEGDVNAVAKLWPGLIDTVKKENPVAATFLRALRPISYQNGLIQIEARYSLHRTFFDKPENTQLLTQSLSSLLGAEVSVRWVMQETPNSIPASADPAAQEQALISAVKEVFGR